MKDVGAVRTLALRLFKGVLAATGEGTGGNSFSSCHLEQR